MASRVIGLNGRLHSGKDSVYEMIKDIAAKKGLTTQRVAFADKLKMSACAALGIPFTDTADAVDICNRIKEGANIQLCERADDGESVGVYHTFSGREYLQWYGTESHRDIFGQDFWVNALMPPWDGMGNTARTVFPDADVVVITDVRFPNEAERILDYGEVWFINADERLGALSHDAHISEQPLHHSLITAVLGNNDTLEELRGGVEFLWEIS